MREAANFIHLTEDLNTPLILLCFHIQQTQTDIIVYRVNLQQQPKLLIDKCIENLLVLLLNDVFIDSFRAQSRAAWVAQKEWRRAEADSRQSALYRGSVGWLQLEGAQCLLIPWREEGQNRKMGWFILELLETGRIIIHYKL